MAADPWKIDRLDLADYLGRLGIAAREPGREALNELHEAQVRSFTFDDIDVLLGQHPGVVPDGAHTTHRSGADHCAADRPASLR
jgi:N-hydroxyarylamine O-acetyltransferase